MAVSCSPSRGDRVPPRTRGFEMPSAGDVCRGAERWGKGAGAVVENPPVLFLPSVSVSPLLPPTEIPPGERQQQPPGPLACQARAIFVTP